MARKTKFNAKKTANKLEKAAYNTGEKLANEVHKDSNYYAPERDGHLKRKVNVFYDSAKRNWVIQWASVYARRLYYGGGFKFQKIKNPNASPFWYSKARTIKLSKWLRFAKKQYGIELERLK